MRMAIFVLFAFFLGAAAATEGGNVSVVNLTAPTNSTWHAVCGQISSSSVSPVPINATPGGITCLTIYTGSSACSRGTGYINILFSNSSDGLVTLTRGNLTILDQFINRPGQNASDTFPLSTTFPTRGWGSITGVPTTYTNSPDPSAFRMGYLNDQSKDIVIIARINPNQTGFNGSIFDFQLMLPTKNGTATTYYLTLDFACTAPPARGGGGSGIPFNQTLNELEAPPEAPPEQPGQPPTQPPVSPPPVNATCIPDVVCGDWGPCVDNSSIQGCEDRNKCSDRELFNVRKCQPQETPHAVGPGTGQGPPEASISEFFLPAAIILLVLLLLIFLYKRRKKK
jgi:hypothetical protein